VILGRFPALILNDLLAAVRAESFDGVVLSFAIRAQVGFVAAGSRLEHFGTAWPTMTDDDASPRCAHFHVVAPQPKPDATQGWLLPYLDNGCHANSLLA
jgi:hypothetical protein